MSPSNSVTVSKLSLGKKSALRIISYVERKLFGVVAQTTSHFEFI